MKTKVNERPILFSSDMVRAILDGRKSVTRRAVAKANSDVSVPWERLEFDDSKIPTGSPWTFTLADNGYLHVPTRPHPEDPQTPNDWTRNRVYPRFEVGGRLWVRETWCKPEPGPLCVGDDIAFRADYLDDPHGPDGERSPEGRYRRWRPSIFLPRWASRIELEITGVRVERFQSFSREDAIAEGIERVSSLGMMRACGWKDYSGRTKGFLDPVASFRTLWDSINGKKHPWSSNPLVWVIEFHPRA